MRFAWPDWAADRSPDGTRIAAGGPICTVLAKADDSTSARALLLTRERADAGVAHTAAGGRSRAGDPVGILASIRLCRSGGFASVMAHTGEKVHETAFGVAMNDAPDDPSARSRPSLGRLAQPLVAQLCRDARALRLGVTRTAAGATIVDAGIAAVGGLEAGRRIAEICLGGLGRVELAAGSPFPAWPFRVSVSASDPVLACLASQYAGWSLAPRRGRRRLSSPWPPGRAARGPPRRSCSASSAIPTPRPSGASSCWRPTGRRRTSWWRRSPPTAAWHPRR